MRMTVCVPFMGHLDELKGVVGQLMHMTNKTTEFLFINNGTDGLFEWLRRYFPHDDWHYSKSPDNLGMVKTMQYAYEMCETEILAIIHNDVFIYEKEWDQRVLRYFKEDEELGVAGFFGAEYIGVGADRSYCWSNMLEADHHGVRLVGPGSLAVAVLDGFCLVFRMDMLKKAGGFDQRYHYHHIYDKAACLQSLALGYRNIVVNIPCHHMSGITAERPQYQEWINREVGMNQADQWTHDENHKLFKEIWDPVLPLRVNWDFSYAIGGDLKGNAIVGYDWKKELVVHE